MLTATILANLQQQPMQMQQPTLHNMAEIFAMTEEKIDSMEFPLSYLILQQAQLQDRQLQKNVTKFKQKYVRTQFHGGGKTVATLLTYKGKIVVPPKLIKQVIHWHHHWLGHPGIIRTEETIKQYL